MKVLLLEPDVVLAKSYARALTKAGYHVRVAYDAQGAIDAADGRMPDVVIIELQIGGHNGIEFLYEFRSYADWQDVPVIVQSWLTPPAGLDVAGQRALRIAGYLYKPQTSLQKLVASVNAQVLMFNE